MYSTKIVFWNISRNSQRNKNFSCKFDQITCERPLVKLQACKICVFPKSKEIFQNFECCFYFPNQLRIITSFLATVLSCCSCYSDKSTLISFMESLNVTVTVKENGSVSDFWIYFLIVWAKEIFLVFEIVSAIQNAFSLGFLTGFGVCKVSVSANVTLIANNFFCAS